jgi:hypothetical protein
LSSLKSNGVLPGHVNLRQRRGRRQAKRVLEQREVGCEGRAAEGFDTKAMVLICIGAFSGWTTRDASRTRLWTNQRQT